MCMGFCIGSAICCAGAACCKAMCLPAKAAGVAAKNYAKIGYVVFSIGWIILTIVMMYILNWIFDWTEWFGFDCTMGGSACTGASALIRTSWSLAIFHVIMLCIVALRNDFAAAFHDGCWGAKFLIVTGIFIASLWIPNDPVMDGYLQFARIVSIFFLMYQALLILVLAYTLNSTLVRNVNREGDNAFSCSGIILITVFVLTFAGDITWLVFQYIEFGGEGCGANIAFLIISTILGVFMHVIVIFRTRDDASVLTSSIVWAYQLYLQWSAMSSSSDPECNPYTHSAGNTTAEIIIGLFFTFLALLIIGGSTTNEGETTVTGEMSKHMMETEDDANMQYNKVG